jgi:hypothetical protein
MVNKRFEVDVGNIGPCLIISKKTGVLWTNQVGGVCCLHPGLEGILIPLNHYWKTTSIEKEYPTKKFIESWIKENNLPLKIKMDAVKAMNKFYKNAPGVIEEAWIPIEITKIKKDKYGLLNVLSQFEGMCGILTYNNSD